MPKFNEREKAVLNAVEGLSFSEWLRISKAVNQTFEEIERRRLGEIKLENIDRVIQIMLYP